MRYKSYEEAYKLSLEKPEEFWGREAEDLHWYKKWDKVLDDSNYPFFRWFVGGKTNLCYNAVDRHALGSKRGTAAIIWESPETGQSRVYTYYHLYKEV
ncbi:MAG: propionyl-CoA synthetase, partial [Methanomicrobia archaeon]|nr:propionyl-CoA synthetase [Methanomicrobia archaeon]